MIGSLSQACLVGHFAHIGHSRSGSFYRISGDPSTPVPVAVRKEKHTVVPRLLMVCSQVYMRLKNAGLSYLLSSAL